MSELTDLIKAGMPKRQARVLATALAAGGGSGAGGALNALVARRPYVNPGEGLVPPWVGNGPRVDGSWWLNGELGLGMDIERLDGEAMTYDAEAGEITYQQDGIYLSHFHSAMAVDGAALSNAGAQLDSTATKQIVAEFVDWQYLDYFQDFLNDSLALSRYRGYDTTWVAVQSAGDTNVLPYLATFRGPNPIQILGANFMTVRLQA